MRNQPRPFRRPAEVAHQLARQAERKVEAADPGPGSREEILERGEAFEPLDFLDLKNGFCEKTHCDGDRLLLARRAGEVDAVDSHIAISS